MKSKILTQSAFRPVGGGGSKLELNCNWGFNLKSLLTLKKCAFTLAEVLITLGIIGVVAAMTLPTLIQNYQNQVHVNQLKKFVSTLEQGFQKMLADEGVERLSDLSNLKDGYDNSTEANAKDAINDFFSRGFQVSYYKATNYTLNGEDAGISDFILFNDGSAIILLGVMAKDPQRLSSADCELAKSKGGSMCSLSLHFIFDTNGIKGPNKWGRDLFFFYVSDEGKLYPHGGKDVALMIDPSQSYESSPYYWKNASNSDGGCDFSDTDAPLGCAARIIENGWVMDY